jgi:hypothetical protein
MAKLLSLQVLQSSKTKIMRRLLFMAIIACALFSCNDSGNSTGSSDTTTTGTDTINSLTGTGTGMGSDTMSGTGTGTDTSRHRDTTGRDTTRR